MATKKEDTEEIQPTPDNVDQIREILFGNQIRAVDDRFGKVEKTVSWPRVPITRQLTSTSL